MIVIYWNGHRWEFNDQEGYAFLEYWKLKGDGANVFKK